MLDFSFLEMLVVFVVGLLVLGPERLPKVARQVGWWAGRIRSSLAGMRAELERETSIQEFRAATRDIEQSIGETVQATKSTVEAADPRREAAKTDPAPAESGKREAP